MSTGMIHIRVDDEIKAQASQTLESMGLSVSEAVRLFLHRVVTDQALPFELRVPNAKTRDAMTEAEAIAQNHLVHFDTADDLFADLEKNSR